MMKMVYVPTTITTCYYFLTKNGQNALWILLNHSCPVLKHYLAIFFFLWTNFRFCFILLCSMTVKAEPWNLDVFTTIVDFQSSYFFGPFQIRWDFYSFWTRTTFKTDIWTFKQTVETDISKGQFKQKLWFYMVQSHNYHFNVCGIRVFRFLLPKVKFYG